MKVVYKFSVRTVKKPEDEHQPRRTMTGRMLREKQLRRSQKIPSQSHAETDIGDTLAQRVTNSPRKPIIDANEPKTMIPTAEPTKPNTEALVNGSADNEAVSLDNIHKQLLSIHSRQAKIETYMRLLTNRRMSSPNPEVKPSPEVKQSPEVKPEVKPSPVDATATKTKNNDKVKTSLFYVHEMHTQQKHQPLPNDERFRCCDHDSHEIPGKLVNFIVVTAIFLHYAIIAFVESNEFV